MPLRRARDRALYALAAICLAPPCAALEAGGSPASMPPLGADLEGSAGFGVLATGSGTESVGVLGAQARVRYAFLHVAGFAERSRAAVDDARTYGGVAGVWLSPPNLPDFDLGLGLAARTYVHETPGGALGDYELSTPAIVARTGVSDRAFGRIGGRLGARLSLSWDTRRHERHFRHQRGGPSSDAPPSERTFVHDSRRIGGLSVVLTMTVALDVGSVQL